MVVSAVKVSQQVLLNLKALLVTPFLFACCCVFLVVVQCAHVTGLIFDQFRGIFFSLDP